MQQCGRSPRQATTYRYDGSAVGRFEVREATDGRRKRHGREVLQVGIDLVEQLELVLLLAELHERHQRAIRDEGEPLNTGARFRSVVTHIVIASNGERADDRHCRGLQLGRSVLGEQLASEIDAVRELGQTLNQYIRCSAM